MDETLVTHDKNHSEQRYSASSDVFKRLQWIYLIGRFIASMADHLPNSYRYALLDSYGFTRSLIEHMSLIAYGSSLILGNFSSAFADHYGRRLICMLAGVFYIIDCFLLNFSLLTTVIAASICWGISNVFYDVGFEAWLIQEHRNRLLDLSSLKRLLRDTCFIIAFTIVFGSLLSQLLVQIGNIRIPFIGSILLWIVTIIFIWYFWTENYGSKETKMTTTFINAFRILQADPRIVLLGLAAAIFDTSSHIMTIEWTPTLQQTQTNSSEYTLPLGIINASFNISNIIGALFFYPLVQRIRSQSYMIILFLLCGIGFMFPLLAPNSLPLVFIGFVLFKLCYGCLYPSFGLLRSLYIPDEVRATMMSYIRIPQLICMSIILLGHFSLTTIYIICVAGNVCGALIILVLRNLKLPEESNHFAENSILLHKPSCPSFDTKQPQLEISPKEQSVQKP